MPASVTAQHFAMIYCHYMAGSEGQLVLLYGTLSGRTGGTARMQFGRNGWVGVNWRTYEEACLKLLREKMIVGIFLCYLQGNFDRYVLERPFHYTLSMFKLPAPEMYQKHP